MTLLLNCALCDHENPICGPNRGEGVAGSGAKALETETWLDIPAWSGLVDQVLSGPQTFLRVERECQIW